MVRTHSLVTLSLGVLLGAVGSWAFFGPVHPVMAASDRHDDYIICTGAAGVTPRSQLDGVWLLDYKQGKLLATIVDRSIGKTVGFADLDLVKEFGLSPNQNVHFLMTTGHIAQGQAALYLVETTTAKFGVYTLGPNAFGSTGVTIMRHDLTSFRKSDG
jgi:hypothetical protein